MHEHQFDMIAAAADGTASPEEAVLADRAVAECDQCAVELRLQTEVLDTLHSARPALMTDLERAALHRSLAAATASKRREVGWYRRYAPRIAAVAAGFAVVGLASVAMLGQLGSDTAETADGIRSPVEAARSGPDVAEAPAANEGLLQDAGGASTEDTVAASMDQATGAEEMASDGGDDALYYGTAEMLPEDLDALLEGEVPIELAAELDEARRSFAALCPDIAPDPELTELAAEVTFSGEPAYVLVYSEENRRIASAVGIPSCEILATTTDAP